MQEPQQIVLGTDMKPKGRGEKRRLVEVMVYVPILQTLQVLLHNHVIRREVSSITVINCTLQLLEQGISPVHILQFE